MKQPCITLLFYFALNLCFAQTETPKLKITPLTGNFYIYTTYQAFNGTIFPANGMYVVTREGTILIDSPWDTTQFQPLLDSIKYKHHQEVVVCIATHSHEDRTGGLEFLRQHGVKTYTTKHTDEISKNRHEKRAEFLIAKDTTFNVGSHRFQTFYAGPGHTPDNIVVWFEQEKILYGGCLIKSTEAHDLGNLADAQVEEWGTTIKKIQSHFKHPNYVIPGHQDWSSNKSLQHTLNLITAYQKSLSK